MKNIFRRTFRHGMGKSRKGSMPISVDKLIKSANGDMLQYFSDHPEKLKEKRERDRKKMVKTCSVMDPVDVCLAIIKLSVSDEDALDAARVLSRETRDRVRQHAETGSIPGVLAPAIHSVGRIAKGFVDAKSKKRLSGALAGLRDTTRGSVAQQVLGGSMGGMAISAGRESLERKRAKDTVTKFISANSERKG